MRWSIDRSGTVDKRSIIGMIEAGEPLIRQAIPAQQRYHAAQKSDQPAKEVERLRREAESLYQTVSEFQLRLLGGPAHTKGYEKLVVP